jgi:WD40 repeat protein
VFSGIILMSILEIVLLNNHLKQIDQHPDATIFPKNIEPWVDYFLDSAYKVVADSQITVYKTKTGEKISAFYKSYEPIRSMAMHPSGSHLLVLSEYTLDVYDLKKDDITEHDTSATWSSDNTEIDVGGNDAIEFSADGKYLMVIDYKEAGVTIMEWPGLQQLAYHEMGGYRSSIRWENKAGKLVFFYEVYRGSKACYRTQFPADPLADSLSFSTPVVIDSLPDSYSNDD